MIRIIFKVIISIIFIISIIVAYLSIVGIETARFNDQIRTQIKKIDNDLDIELKKINIVLDPFQLSINAKTIGTKLRNKEKFIEIENIKTQLSIKAFLNNEFLITSMYISSKTLEIKNLISFLRNFINKPELYILERIVGQGFLVADIKLKFDSKGKIKKNYEIKGSAKDISLKIFDNYNIKETNFNFNINDESFNFTKIKINFNNTEFISDQIQVAKNQKKFFINGNFKNTISEITEKEINFLNKKLNLGQKIEKLNLLSNNQFSFEINNKFKFNNLKIMSELKIDNLILRNDYKLENFLPNIKDKIQFTNHKLEVNFDKKNLFIKGNGNILIQDKFDKLSYIIKKKDNDYDFLTSLNITENPFLFNLLGYKKNIKNDLLITFNAKYFSDNKLLIDTLNLEEKINKIHIEKLILDKDLNFNSVDKIILDYFDKDKKKNQITITKKKKNYLVKGSIFNLDYLINKFMNNEQKKKKKLFKDNLNINFEIDEIIVDDEHNMENFRGDLLLSKNNIINSNLEAILSKNKRMQFTINSDSEGKVTTLFLGNAKPIINRYKFIKGFEDGSLDFYSIDKDNRSQSTLKIYNFKLKELPVLTKILTLASLQGIADILSGEGIRFDEFEMNFENQDSLMKIEEIYAIGPAISILMSGYVEKNKIVSLRGTLVPATTVNKVIGSIPVLGKILVGNKTGEGVFGVSFKIKGPPKKLETTVNPIKTLTPRFITRTLEKIKKTN